MDQTKKLRMYETMYITEDKKIVVQKGVLWVTFINDSRDYFYKEGQAFEVKANNAAVLEAISSSSFTLKCIDELKCIRLETISLKNIWRRIFKERSQWRG